MSPVIISAYKNVKINDKSLTKLKKIVATQASDQFFKKVLQSDICGSTY